MADIVNLSEVRRIRRDAQRNWTRDPSASVSIGAESDAKRVVITIDTSDVTLSVGLNLSAASRVYAELRRAMIEVSRSQGEG